MSILDGIENKKPATREALLIEAVRELQRELSGMRRAAWWVAGTFLVAAVGLVTNVISGAFH